MLLQLCLLILVLEDGALSAPADGEIRCVEIDKCPSLVDLLRKHPINEKIQGFLKDINCGYTITKPKIWCKANYESCLSPDGQEGHCGPYKKCPVFLDRLVELNVEDEDSKAYIKEFECKNVFEEGVKVCCPTAPTDTNLLAIAENPSVNYPTEPPEKTPLDLTPNLVLFTSPDLGTSSIRPLLESKSLIPKAESYECGRQRWDFRIIGGDVTDIDEFPWVAILQYRSNSGVISQKCQGVIVSSRYVLTAAHCLGDRNQILDSVVLGEYDTRNETDCVYYDIEPDCAPPVQVIKVEKVIPHPERSVPFYNDIALIRLQWEASFHDFVRPICLPPVDFDISTYSQFTIAGWGQTETDERSALKRKVDLEQVKTENCAYIFRNVLRESQLCLGANSRDSCTGDSGSPVLKLLNINSSLAWYLVGIVSLGYNNPCGVYPGVYTYIPPYVNWIHDTVEP